MPPAFDAYGALVEEIFAGLDVELLFEPGRALVGNAGILVTEVLYVKQAGERPIVVVDAAMNDLKRPAMYSAYHPIVAVAEPEAGAAVADVDVVGPVCETGDTFATRRPMPPVAAGDLLALGAAGAYGAVMASMYNSRPLVPEVLVADDRFAVVRSRPTYEDMIRSEAVPEWLAPDATPTGPGAKARAQRGAA